MQPALEHEVHNQDKTSMND